MINDSPLEITVPHITGVNVFAVDHQMLMWLMNIMNINYYQESTQAYPAWSPLVLHQWAWYLTAIWGSSFTSLQLNPFVLYISPFQTSQSPVRGQSASQGRQDIYSSHASTSTSNSRIRTLQTSRSVQGGTVSGWVWAASPACLPVGWRWAAPSGHRPSRQTGFPAQTGRINIITSCQHNVEMYPVVSFNFFSTLSRASLKKIALAWRNTLTYAARIKKDAIPPQKVWA